MPLAGVIPAGTPALLASLITLPKLVVSLIEPILIVSAVVLSVPILIVFPAAPIAIFVEPVELNVVKAPVEAVVAPMAVELMPVAVVLKLEDEIVKAFIPVLIEEAPRPESVKPPDVAVRLSAPPVTVKPFEAVSSPAEVMVPVPDVEIFPDVVMLSPDVAGDSVVAVLFQ